ncbi:hypothetical protein QTJ16_000824 [Diplocarpon rosae]|uniref:Glycosyltransferase family 32 protein n=1 Tax=Diplocarpon rosae TaxID=946125 RepID=A0AAD9WHV5_9HELO|nr:hypothetical protein QTJ16_000824 [Diplocarpon rosae]
MLLSHCASLFRQHTAGISALLLVLAFGHYFIWTRGSLWRLTRDSRPSDYVTYENTTSSDIVTPTVTITFQEPAATLPPATVTITVHEPAATILQPAEPVPIATSIPQKLWYKSGPKGVSDEAAQWMESCLGKNPSLRREILTDQSGDTYVKESYAHRPDIVSIYLALPVPILKADFLRYLILYAQGGIWSDLDVSCEDVPVEKWIPEQYEKSAGLVVGLEFDGPDWQSEENVLSCFASWMIMAKPRSPHLLMVIEDVLQGILEMSEEHKVPISGLTYGMISDVVDVTGPKRMTRSVIKSLQLQLKEKIGDRNTSGLTEPKLLGDVLILPGNAFASQQNGYPVNQGPALVTHHYAGSWKNDYGGERVSPPPPAPASTDSSEQAPESEQQQSQEAGNKEKENQDQGRGDDTH